MSAPPPPPPPARAAGIEGVGRLSWGNPAVRGLVWQALLLAAVLWLGWTLLSNTLANLAARNIATGFDFLGREAGFAIGETAIAYQPSDSYARAIAVGLLNTLKVSAVGIVLATLLGTLLGIARLSPNWLASRLAAAYVEFMRNVPLLLQLLLWYALITENLPGPRQAIEPLPGVFLSNRGLALPALSAQAAQALLIGLGLGIAAAVALAHLGRRGGPGGRRAWLYAVLLLGGPLLALLGWGGDEAWRAPSLRGFNFQGGVTLSPEFAALMAGLVGYTSAFVAEVVRAGIQAVPRGQWEAAASLGLTRARTLRLVVLPQALRVIVPPMTSQYLNLTKNSSLAVAIGYPDLVSVVNTTLNQTGQAIEGVAIIMAAYLVVSLSIAALMNLYNRRLLRQER